MVVDLRPPKNSETGVLGPLKSSPWDFFATFLHFWGGERGKSLPPKISKPHPFGPGASIPPGKGMGAPSARAFLSHYQMLGCSISAHPTRSSNNGGYEYPPYRVSRLFCAWPSRVSRFRSRLTVEAALTTPSSEGVPRDLHVRLLSFGVIAPATLSGDDCIEPNVSHTPTAYAW